MATYRVELTKNAAKEIKRLNRSDQIKAITVLEMLETTPRPRGIEKLKENPSFYRVKVGRDFRMVYTVDDEKLLIVIALVRDRKEAYRGLGNLDAERLIADIEPLRDQLRPSGPFQ